MYYIHIVIVYLLHIVYCKYNLTTKVEQSSLQPRINFMEYCETCKYWLRISSKEYELPNTGVCSAAKQFWETTDWDRDNPTRTLLLPKFTGTLMFVQDSSDQFAQLKTMYNFGCVQHQFIGE